MSDKFYRPDQLSLRYAVALIDLAEDKKVMTAVEKDVKGLLALMDESQDLRLLIKNPQISADVKANVFGEIAKVGGLSDIMANFVGVLIKNKRLSIVQTVLKTVLYELERRQGIVSAGVTVANDLSDAQKKNLEKILNQAMGATVRLQVNVDESIIGGMIVTVGSKMIDDSVGSKLERMRQTMAVDGESNVACTV